MLNSQYRVFDPNDIPVDVAKFLAFWLAKKGLDYLWKKHAYKLKHTNIRRNFAWFQVGCHIVSFLASAYLEILFKKIHLKPLAKVCDRVSTRNIQSGFMLFYKLEPKLATEIVMKIQEFVNNLRIRKITGVDSNQRDFPNI